MQNEKIMIAVDLDGTLLNKEGRVTEETKKYLKNLKDKGYIITIATGRILTSSLYATDGAEFTNYIITDTGPSIFKMPNQEVVYEKSISKDTASRFLDLFDENKMRYIDIANPRIILKYTTKYPEENIIVKNYNNKGELLKEADGKAITHITVRPQSNENIKELYAKFVEEFPELQINIMQDSFSENQFIQTNLKGENKYKAICEIARIEGISNENIIAFGDSPNDKMMIKNSGVGVAMQNALQDVKDVANYATKKPHYENGVIEFLKEYLNGKTNE